MQQTEVAGVKGRQLLLLQLQSQSVAAESTAALQLLVPL